MPEWQQWAYWGLACGAVWLLYRIFQLVKAIHFMIHDDFKRKRPEVFRDD
jgi:hypothetical protein